MLKDSEVWVPLSPSVDGRHPMEPLFGQACFRTNVANMVTRRETNLRNLTCLIAGLLTVMSGCGAESDRPKLGTVSGIVSLDGKPLANAGISFRPVEGGRVSQGRTDQEGRYRLIYLDNPHEVPGAKVGENVVYVSTYLSEEATGGPQKELVPKCYRVKDSVKRVQVNPGSNEIDLELNSQCSP